MEEIDEEFLNLVEEFLESSRTVRDAAELVDGDPIKQEMIKETLTDFNDVCDRSMLLKDIVENDYSANRHFVMKELKEITALNYKIAATINRKLAPLVWN